MQANSGQDRGAWTFRNEDSTEASQPNQAPEQTPQAAASQPVTWTASEFIAHHKDPTWYALVSVGFLALCIVIYLVTGDVISVVTISVVFVLFLIISGNKPQQRAYTVDSHGISIGEKFYPYGIFKSFAILHEGAIGSINFMPLKRFMPELSIYFAPEDEARIIEILINNLPHDQRPEKGVDRLMKRLRF